LHDEENFTYLGRRDNVINSGGVKIFPEVVERKLANHIDFPFFVYGIPDKVLGEKLILVVEGEEHLLRKFKLNQTSLKGLDKFEVPKEIFYVSEILRNNGKYLREKTINKLIIR
jgi:O-succinylbenzoic acid--CoA ligase